MVTELVKIDRVQLLGPPAPLAPVNPVLTNPAEGMANAIQGSCLAKRSLFPTHLSQKRAASLSRFHPACLTWPSPPPFPLNHARRLKTQLLFILGLLGLGLLLGADPWYSRLRTYIYPRTYLRSLQRASKSGTIKRFGDVH